MVLDFQMLWNVWMGSMDWDSAVAVEDGRVAGDGLGGGGHCDLKFDTFFSQFH